MSRATGCAITVDELSPVWLGEVLHREGVLPPTLTVTAIEKARTSAFNSYTLHLTPNYAPIPQAEATYPITMAETNHASPPARLLLKCSLPQAWAKRAGAREVAFYKMVRSLPDHPSVVVRCYDAEYDAESGNSHLLLDDLSASHVIPVPRDKQITLADNLPSNTHLMQAVDALARFHAYWWQHPQLGNGAAQLGAWCSDTEHFAAETARRWQAWEALITNEKAWFPSNLAAMYENILDQLMHLWQSHLRPRLDGFRHLTLTHGDAYLANFLCPQPGAEHGEFSSAYIIDWQSPEIYLGPSDLVTMCATFWTRQQRAEGERELNVLRRYHRTLQENGVRGYAWDDLVRDYQYSLVDWLLVPLQDRLDGADKSYWWPKMQCLAHAFEDWRVSELFT